VPNSKTDKKYPCQCRQSTKTDRNIRVSAAKALSGTEISVSVAKTPKDTDVSVSVSLKETKKYTCKYGVTEIKTAVS